MLRFFDPFIVLGNFCSVELVLMYMRNEHCKFHVSDWEMGTPLKFCRMQLTSSCGLCLWDAPVGFSIFSNLRLILML